MRLSNITADFRRWIYKYRFELVALLIASIAAWPLWREAGLLNTRGGGDSPFLLQRVHQLATALRDGHFPVRWMPHANYGYGYPFFNYYAPLSIYIPAGLHILGFSIVASIKLTQLLGFWLAGGAMYRLATNWFGDKWVGLLASSAYTLAPFHLVNVYVRGDSLAEFWAMALYPVVLWAADRPGKSGTIWLGISYSALVLSHNISAMIFTPFLLLYVLWRAWQGQDRRLDWMALRHSGTGVALGLLLSAWFWLPALAETGLAQTDPVTSGYFHYSNHFLDSNLVQPSLLFDFDVAGGGAFRMGLVQVVFVFVGLVGFFTNQYATRNTKYLLRIAYSVLALFIATFMLTSLSTFLWANLPLLPFTQFPWRFLSVQAFGGAMIAGGIGLWRGREVVAPAGIVILLITALGQLKTDHLPLSDVDITAERLGEYEWFIGNIGTTVSAEYLPHTVSVRPYTGSSVEIVGDPNIAESVGSSAVGELSKWRSVRQTWRVVAQQRDVLIIPTLYWPGWVAEADGEELAVTPAEGSGLITVDVPAGEYTLTLKLTRTPPRLLAELLSSLTLLGLALGISRKQVIRIARNGGVIVLGLLVIGQLWPDPAYATGTETWDFAQLGYLHHSPAGVPFSDGNRLLHYEFTQDWTSPTDATWHLSLQWVNPIAATDVQVALTNPAGTRFPSAPDFMSQSQPMAETMDFTFELPPNLPAGLIIPRLTVDNAYALTDSGTQRGELYLRPWHFFAGSTPGIAERLEVSVENVIITGDIGSLPADSTPDYSLGCSDDISQIMQIHLGWQTHEHLLPNYKRSLRLSDSTGLALAQCDHQLGYGYAPTSLWSPSIPAYEWIGLPLPSHLPTDSTLPLTVQLYEPGTGETYFTRRLGELVWQAGEWFFVESEPLFAVPAGLIPTHINFSDLITLHGYTLAQTTAQIDLTLAWGALAPGQADYARFVHLLDPTTGEIITQADGVPQYGSYPTSQWTAGEVVVDRLVLDVNGVPAGEYQLAIGLYEPQEPYPRLPATDPQNEPLPDNRLIIPLSIEP